MKNRKLAKQEKAQKELYDYYDMQVKDRKKTNRRATNAKYYKKQ